MKSTALTLLQTFSVLCNGPFQQTHVRGIPHCFTFGSPVFSMQGIMGTDLNLGSNIIQARLNTDYTYI